jgi:hypothetical protein
MAKIKLHHTMYEGLAFGPEKEIQFGPRGGFDLGMWVGPEDHPLLPALFAAEGAYLEVVTDVVDARVYVSPIDPDREFKSKPALLAHLRAAAAKGNKLAKDWLASYGGKDDAEPVDDAEE